MVSWRWGRERCIKMEIDSIWGEVLKTTEKAMAPHSSTLAWKIHGWRSLVGCSPWGREESDTTEQLHFHFSLSCIGEGNGNPLQCSCLENPRDGGAWWAAVSGVAQSRTQLKRFSSSSSRDRRDTIFSWVLTESLRSLIFLALKDSWTLSSAPQRRLA